MCSKLNQTPLKFVEKTVWCECPGYVWHNRLISNLISGDVFYYSLLWNFQLQVFYACLCKCYVCA